MDGQPLWVLCDYFQRWLPGFPGDSRWVRQSDAEAAVAAESARIRRELEEWLDSRGFGDVVPHDGLRLALDRILPEEE